VHNFGIEIAYLCPPHQGLTGFDSKPKVDVSMSSAEGAARKYTASFFLTGEDSYALAA